MNRLKPEKQARMLHDVVEAGSLRSIERKHQTSFNTVMKLFEDAGDMALAHFASQSELVPARIQADEFHTYVGSRDKDREPNSPRDRGTHWVYLAIDADSKCVLHFSVGSREVYDATDFMKTLASKLLRNERGEFAVRPTIITDGLPAYKEASAIAFGTDADVGMLIKKYSDTGKKGQKLSRRRYIGADRITLLGSPAWEDVHTSFIERVNLNFRMDVKRFTRRTNAFSKNLPNLKRHVALYSMYYNYCRVHRTLRMTPAMAAGWTDHIWEVDELVEMTNRFVLERLKSHVSNDQDDVPDPLPEGAPTHWVYHSPIHYRAKVHEAQCYHCKGGQGHRRGKAKSGTWHPFHSLEDAMTAAAQFEPDRHEICNTCIGSYRNAGGYRGPRR